MPNKPVCLYLVALALGCGRAAPPPDGGPPPIVEAFATTPDSVRLYYRVAGTGSETVLAPFALFLGSSLDRLARGRRIVTYDPRGRGRSDSVPDSKVSR